MFLILVSCGKEENSNARLKYGTMGGPYDGRALIKSNIDGYDKGKYSAEAALNSINRNCGEKLKSMERKHLSNSKKNTPLGMNFKKTTRKRKGLFGRNGRSRREERIRKVMMQ